MEGLFQFMRAELCTGGDAERYIQEQPDRSLPAATIRSLLFQLCFSLYAARERLSLRHYDVKLLNVLLQPARTLVTTEEAAQVELRYGFGQHQFRLALDADAGMVVKWADWGTADSSVETLGTACGPQHVTTVENAPPELWILGDGAVQVRAVGCISMVLHAHTHTPARARASRATPWTPGASACVRCTC